MLSLLLSLLLLLVIFAVVYWIATLIPVPPPFAWIVQVVIGIIFLVCLIELLTGGFAFGRIGVLR